MAKKVLYVEKQKVGVASLENISFAISLLSVAFFGTLV